MKTFHPPPTKEAAASTEALTATRSRNHKQDTSQTANGKAFIPAWLNQAGLSQAEFRVYCCLASRADIKTGIAWPQADSISRDCIMAKNTVWKTLRSLEQMKFIRKAGKPFAGSNRYQVLVPIGANEIPIETPPIGANEILQSAQMDSHQSAQMDSRECTPKNVHQRMFTNKGESIDLPFASDVFAEAWKEWTQHRTEIRKKLTPTSIKKQLKELSAMGEAGAIAAINHSIAKGYTGIFPPASQAKPDHRAAKAATEYPEETLTIPRLA